MCHPQDASGLTHGVAHYTCLSSCLSPHPRRGHHVQRSGLPEGLLVHSLCPREPTTHPTPWNGALPVCTILRHGRDVPPTPCGGRPSRQPRPYRVLPSPVPSLCVCALLPS